MKYIVSEELIAEVEKRIQWCEDCERDGYPDTTSSEATLKSLRSFITSLQQEQPEEDLEKSRNLIRDTLNGVTRLGSLCDDQTIEHAVDNLIDELGLNARKK